MRKSRNRIVKHDKLIWLCINLIILSVNNDDQSSLFETSESYEASLDNAADPGAAPAFFSLSSSNTYFYGYGLRKLTLTIGVFLSRSPPSNRLNVTTKSTNSTESSNDVASRSYLLSAASRSSFFTSRSIVAAKKIGIDP